MTFAQPGVYDVMLTVTDSHGAASTAKVQVAVGNAPPRVRLLEPANGGFFDWDQPIEYRATVEDEEDGSTAKGTIPPERVSVQATYLPRRGSTEVDNVHPGLALMRKTTCFACHAAGDQSKGPPYALVAQKYAQDATAREKLAKKVVSGGGGAWGAYPMPPHPQHTVEQTRLMVDWIMTLTAGHQVPPTPGAVGGFTAMPRPDPSNEHGLYVITARYTDNGAAGAPPLTGEATSVLHARKKKPAFADVRSGIEVVHELEGKVPIFEGMVARFAPNGYARFDQMSLAGIDRVQFMAGSAEGAAGAFELHADSPTGPLVASIVVDAKPGYRLTTAPVQDPGGVHDLFLVAHPKSGGKGALSLIWLEFLDSPTAAAARARVNAAAAQRAVARQQLFKARPFVKDWKLDDLAGSLGELDRGRSFARGQALFKSAACASCHKMGKDGGTLGPDLTEVAKRLAKQPMPRLALLREVLEPSAVIDEKFRTHIVVLDDGTQKAGIIVEQDTKGVRIAANPAAPDERMVIPRTDRDDQEVRRVADAGGIGVVPAAGGDSGFAGVRRSRRRPAASGVSQGMTYGGPLAPRADSGQACRSVVLSPLAEQADHHPGGALQRQAQNLQVSCFSPSAARPFTRREFHVQPAWPHRNVLRCTQLSGRPCLPPCRDRCPRRRTLVPDEPFPARAWRLERIVPPAHLEETSGPRPGDEPCCTCGEKLPELERVTFTFTTGREECYLLGQCAHCGTVFWEET